MLPYSKSPHKYNLYTIQAEIVYRGFRVAPPRHLRSRILHTLHRDHPGIVHMIRLVRQHFWWPGINASINAFIQRCHTCQVNARKWTSQHLRSWEDARMLNWLLDCVTLRNLSSRFWCSRLILSSVCHRLILWHSLWNKVLSFLFCVCCLCWLGITARRVCRASTY